MVDADSLEDGPSARVHSAKLLRSHRTQVWGQHLDKVVRVHGIACHDVWLAWSELDHPRATSARALPGDATTVRHVEDDLELIDGVRRVVASWEGSG